MKINIKDIVSNLKKAIIRFPLSMGIASVATLAALGMVARHSTEDNFLVRVLISGIIWYFASIASYISFEKYKINPDYRNLISLLIGFLFVGTIFYLPKSETPYLYWYQSGLLTFVFILAVGFIGFSLKDSMLSFWFYTKTLIFNFLISSLFALILQIGLSLSLLSLDQLFNVRINENWYAYISIVLWGIFHAWVFLSLFPNDNSEPLVKVEKLVKTLSLYIMLPVVALYGVILTAYLSKIIIIGIWPEGYVSYLVINYSIAGLLTFYLAYPFLKEGFLKFLHFIYFGSLIPLLFMLFAAITMRSNEYGITVNRYYVYLIGIWLLLISIYFLLKKFDKIWLIPVSLSVFVLLSTFGPWSAFSMAANSQKNRLEQLLIKNEMLKNGKASKPAKTIDEPDAKEIFSIIEYLYLHEGTDALQPYFDTTLTGYSKKSSYYDIAQLLGIDGSKINHFVNNSRYYNVSRTWKESFGFEIESHYYQKINLSQYNNEFEYQLGSNEFNTELTKQEIVMEFKNEKIRIPNTVLFKNFGAKNNIEPNEFVFVSETNQLKVSIYFENISFEMIDNKIIINRMNADVFVKLK